MILKHRLCNHSQPSGDSRHWRVPDSGSEGAGIFVWTSKQKYGSMLRAWLQCLQFPVAYISKDASFAVFHCSAESLLCTVSAKNSIINSETIEMKRISEVAVQVWKSWCMTVLELVCSSLWYFQEAAVFPASQDGVAAVVSFSTRPDLCSSFQILRQLAWNSFRYMNVGLTRILTFVSSTSWINCETEDGRLVGFCAAVRTSNVTNCFNTAHGIAFNGLSILGCSPCL